MEWTGELDFAWWRLLMRDRYLMDWKLEGGMTLSY